MNQYTILKKKSKKSERKFKNKVQRKSKKKYL